MDISYKFFEELPDEARLIRQEVFMDEQGFKNEFDDTDKCCVHLVLYSDGSPAAVGRLYKTGEKVCTLGRIAVRKQFRGMGLGAEVMGILEQKAIELEAEITAVSAQCAARGFYERLGYKASGQTYFDEHCRHIHMEKDLRHT